MRNFKDKVVVITGGAKGIGGALALMMAKDHAKVAILDFDDQETAKKVNELNAYSVARGYHLNVSDYNGCVEVMNNVIKDFGDIDVLINNAGTSHRSMFYETKIETIKKVIDINEMGTIYATHAAIKSIIKTKGQIVATISVAGFTPLVGRVGYCASKHAIVGIMNTLRSEYKNFGVRVTTVCPTFVKTDLEKTAMGPDGKAVDSKRTTAGKVLTTEKAAELLYSAIKKEKKNYYLGFTAKMAHLLSFFFPSWYENIMIKKTKPEFKKEFTDLAEGNIQ